MHGKVTWNHMLTLVIGYIYHEPRKRISEISSEASIVYFASFQDVLGRDKAGNIKSKNLWIHKIEWDLVVFDEYHFGAWRDTARH